MDVGGEGVGVWVVDGVLERAKAAALPLPDAHAQGGHAPGCGYLNGHRGLGKRAGSEVEECVEKDPKRRSI